MKNLNELEKKYEELGEEIKKLKQKKKWVREKAKNGERYYMVDDINTIGFTKDEADEFDSRRYKVGNYYLAYEEAEKEAKGGYWYKNTKIFYLN